MEINKNTIKELTLDDIINWCIENKQVKWLKAKAAEQIEQPIYPTVEYVDKNGEKKTKPNKKAEPIGKELVNIPYVNIKRDWIAAFFPELAPKKKEKKLTMWERIAALEE
jgi:hypothetical protein